MITDIPTAQEFHDTGVEYSMMAYSTIVDLFLVFEEHNHFEADDLEEYWNSARGKLKNSTSLLHQGIDFLLKSKICEISPYLLIDNSPEKIPKMNGSNQASYSDFFTHDSSKLPKIYNAYCSPPLTDRFRELYEKSRTRRNKIVHTIDNNLTLEAKTIIQESIELIRYFLNDRWVDLRRDFLENSSEFQLHFESEIINQTLLWEFSALHTILPDQRFKQIYGVSKKTRFFKCPKCTRSDYVYDPPNTALLTPNTAQSDEVTCLICDEQFDVIRVSCAGAQCKSNVILADSDECLICGEGN